MWLIKISSFDGIKHLLKIEVTEQGLQVKDTLIPWREIVSKANDKCGMDCILDVAREIQDVNESSVEWSRPASKNSKLHIF